MGLPSSCNIILPNISAIVFLNSSSFTIFPSSPFTIFSASLIISSIFKQKHTTKYLINVAEIKTLKTKHNYIVTNFNLSTHLHRAVQKIQIRRTESNPTQKSNSGPEPKLIKYPNGFKILVFKEPEPNPTRIEVFRAPECVQN